MRQSAMIKFMCFKQWRNQGGLEGLKPPLGLIFISNKAELNISLNIFIFWR